MKICFVNWAPYKDKRAGGVSVYNNNIISHFINKHDIYTISSGVSYNIFKKNVFYKKNSKNIDIINSRVVAPSHFSFSSPFQISDQETEEVFCKALSEIPDLDVIHFNNLEGIPINTLRKIKQKFPNMKIIYSAHNYYALCPQVNLWYNEQKNCTNFNKGKKCISCLPNEVRSTSVIKAYFLDSILKKLRIKNDTIIYNKLWSLFKEIHIILYKIINKKNSKNNDFIIKNYNQSFDKEKYYNRRLFFKNCINENVDIVLGVSDRVTNLLKNYGYNNVITSYIGTKFANNIKNKDYYLENKKIKSIGYMGYMRNDKGFYFFMEAMKKIDKDTCQNLDLIIAAKNTNHHMMYEIKKLTKKFNNVFYFDGYNEKNVNEIMSIIDLGIIPSLWEDNLPQVAIEYHAKKIPILSSNLGGSSELNNKNELFLYNHKSKKELIEKITYLVNYGYNEKEYWENTIKPITIENHCEELISIYKSL